MARKKRSKVKVVDIKFRRKRFHISLDQILFFKIIHRLHGRFWGVASIAGLIIGISICYLIKPEMLDPSLALSEFGNDVRTAPYFAGTMFFSSYALWRWKNYLARTLKRPRPILGLLTLTIVGLYLVALMPYGWRELPYRIHLFGVMLVGISIAALIIFDALLSRTVKGKNQRLAQGLKYSSFIIIIVGGWLTLGSVDSIGWYDVSLIGEGLMILGFAVWVGIKTYLGEGKRSALSRLLSKMVLVD